MFLGLLSLCFKVSFYCLIMATRLFGSIFLPRDSFQDGKKQNAVTTDEDQPMAYDGKDTVEMKTNSGSSQNDKLYAAEGILDPRKRRAEKKRRKTHKLNKTNEMDADYDFTVDYHMKDLPPDMMTAGEDESNGEDGKINKEVPMSGVEFDA